MNKFLIPVVAAAFILSLTAILSFDREPEAQGTARNSNTAGASEELLPDLGMARLTNFSIQRTGGRKLLRFSSVVANTGDGKFEVYGSRPDARTETMTTGQHVYDLSGEYRTQPTDAVMYFGGDGHNHWHVRDLESFDLRRFKDKKTVRVGAKHGFCFFDNTRFGSRSEPAYTGCGASGDLDVTMGLSPGWADIYQASLPDQYVDITGLPDGRYRMVGIADEADWFEESNEENNFTWVEIKIAGGKVSILKYGPAARAVS